MSNGKRGVIYARYSAGPHQTEQSIEGQVRECKRYAQKNGITIVGEYIDWKACWKGWRNIILLS